MAKNRKKIGLIGLRSVPNKYGGFESFGEIFCEYVCKDKYEIYVVLENAANNDEISHWCANNDVKVTFTDLIKLIAL